MGSFTLFDTLFPGVSTILIWCALYAVAPCLVCLICGGSVIYDARFSFYLGVSRSCAIFRWLQLRRAKARARERRAVALSATASASAAAAAFPNANWEFNENAVSCGPGMNRVGDRDDGDDLGNGESDDNKDGENADAFPVTFDTKYNSTWMPPPVSILPPTSISPASVAATDGTGAAPTFLRFPGDPRRPRKPKPHLVVSTESSIGDAAEPGSSHPPPSPPSSTSALPIQIPTSVSSSAASELCQQLPHQFSLSHPSTSISASPTSTIAHPHATHAAPSVFPHPLDSPQHYPGSHIQPHPLDTRPTTSYQPHPHNPHYVLPFAYQPLQEYPHSLSHPQPGVEFGAEEPYQQYPSARPHPQPRSHLHSPSVSITFLSISTRGS